MNLHAGLVKMGVTPTGEDEVVPVGQLDPNTQAVVPRLKAGAVQSWYAPQHPGWSIYYKVRAHMYVLYRVRVCLRAGAQVYPSAAKGKAKSRGVKRV